MNEKASKEADAYRLFAGLLDQAEEVCKCFIAAGLPLPPPLIRLRGQEEKEAPKPAPARETKQFVPTHRPQVAQSDWIFVPVREMATQDLVLAFMRVANEPVRPKDMVAKVKGVHLGVLPGTVYNIFPRLEGKTIARGGGGTWTLPDPSNAPLLDGEFAWGPPQIFCKESSTEYRRLMILQRLADMPTGLTALQLVDSLRDCLTLADKDTVKGDTIALRKRGLVKKGYQRKWSLVDDKNAKG